MSSLDHPPHSAELKVSFPAEHVLQLTLNRPKALNAMTPQMEADINNILNWFDNEESLWFVRMLYIAAVIITGEGRAFCAGADLKAWNEKQSSGQANEQEMLAGSVHGFGSISRRSKTSKPIIAAVNGGTYGGGLEMLLNCDIVIASEEAQFALPEVKRGVLAAQGVIPRIAKIAGHQLASELLLLGRPISAAEAQTRFRFVNQIVPASKVLPTAVEWAKQIVANSPDAVQCTKRGLILAGQHGNFEQATLALAWSPEARRLYNSANIKEGLKAFSEKRKPSWSNPAKL
ncbi:ClpP/crotonase [Gloeophyllum trabeum ATCC 11539]|uniref:ClpP/crotonase n=1 Tax=Gloeophyllum trabeum (strain ATCC 11539 / FP-39264 / Madison 617) TaxID=670483 RepID=S7S365_GLOTA|nr:ClpP/crotonase [Gloeophyllum trabeum ATCC 11539]EPQ60279.1 ClpP/crotonase [Gloeophyllum trabeum ATCC 11539]